MTTEPSSPRLRFGIQFSLLARRWRRVLEAHLTAAGQQRVAEIRRELAKKEAEMLAEFSDTEIAVMLAPVRVARPAVAVLCSTLNDSSHLARHHVARAGLQPRRT